MRSLFVCTGHRKDALCFLALTRRVAGTGAASPGDSARAGTLPCAGVAGRHALPRECRGARPFCGFSGRAVSRGRAGPGAASPCSDHAQHAVAGAFAASRTIPGGKAAQGVQGSPWPPTERAGLPSAEPGPRNGARRLHLPWEVYLCALPIEDGGGRGKTDSEITMKGNHR